MMLTRFESLVRPEHHASADRMGLAFAQAWNGISRAMTEHAYSDENLMGLGRR